METMFIKIYYTLHKEEWQYVNKVAVTTVVSMYMKVLKLMVISVNPDGEKQNQLIALFKLNLTKVLLHPSQWKSEYSMMTITFILDLLVLIQILPN